MSGIFKPANLCRAFFGLLGLGAVKTVGDLASLYILARGGQFAYVLPMFLKKLVGNFSGAALTYILYWFAKRKSGDEPEEAKEPEPEDENLIPAKTIERASWVIYILVLAGMLIFFELRIK